MKKKTATALIATGLIFLHLSNFIPYAEIYKFIKIIEMRYIFSIIGVVLIVTPFLLANSTRNKPDKPRTISFWWLLIGSIVVLISTWASIYWLLSEAEEGQRIDAIRTGLTVGAGTGGAMALLISARRQWLGEQTFLHEIEVSKENANDALEKRITELQANAANQISSESAPTRLSGLYTLERLAQDNPRHRQVIINIICAYLRMPFNPKREDLEEGDDPQKEIFNHHEQEREVRLAAQDILALHLRETPNGTSQEDQYWPGMRLNLSRATLIDIDFSGCTTFKSHFEKAEFHGRTNFSKASLGSASFEQARFTNQTDFSDCQFTGTATLRGVEFLERCVLNNATFLGDADFRECKIRGDLDFENTSFLGGVDFSQSEFENGGHFYRCKFDGNAAFARCEFKKSSIFIECDFKKKAEFVISNFADAGVFDRSRFHGTTSFKGSKFTGDAHFEEVSFQNYASMKAIKVQYTGRFEGASFNRASFSGARFGNTATFEGATLSGDINLAGAHFSWGPLVEKTIVIKSERQIWPKNFSVEWQSKTEGFLIGPNQEG
ncbi:pentapeptide repeat-containing protein [Nocardiopsis sp. NPDC057823]|uniref:pentapeptide repeat-containing protein n=1 Tax=Nocardiopsis sp. NPDC057823 TaxID=3346256 RepID=UPI003670C38C